MNLRKILFWLHLSAGVFAGIVVFIMSVTGVLLTYEKQMLAWADLRHFRAVPAAEAQRVPMEVLLAKVRDEKGSLPSAVTLRPDPSDPVAFVFGREGTVYANPYTGELLGEGSSGVRSFFRVVTDWHRWLGAGGDSRTTGKAVTGACNLAFLFIVCSGLYLWWPRSWRWPNVKGVILFRGGLSPKARDFNWHNVIGFWCCVPLFFIVLGATVISYPWASNLVYRAVGEEPPARRAPGGPGGAPPRSGPRGESTAKAEVRTPPDAERQGAEGKQTERRAEGPNSAMDGESARGEGRREGPHSKGSGEARRGEGGGSPSPGGSSEQPADLNLEGFDQLFARAAQEAPAWTSISLRLPSSDSEPVSLAIDEGMGGQPHLRSTLTLHRQTAEVEKRETFSDSSRGQQLRSFLRFVHTGEVGGFPGQTIAGIASLGACFLVWTGLALSWRRFRAWMGRRGSAKVVPIGAAAARTAAGELETETSREVVSKGSR